jgi:hypothetical protein
MEYKIIAWGSNGWPCPDFGVKAFDRRGREGLAEVAKKSISKVGHYLAEQQVPPVSLRSRVGMTSGIASPALLRRAPLKMTIY